MTIKIILKYCIVFLMMFHLNVNFAFSQENISVHVTYTNLNSEYVNKFLACLNKNSLTVVKSAQRDFDNVKRYDHNYKLYRYYKSSIQINFYNAYLNNDSIDEDVILFYYIGINEKHFEKTLKKMGTKFLPAKKFYNIYIDYHNNNALVLAVSPGNNIIYKKFNVKDRVLAKTIYSDAIDKIKKYCLN